MDEQQVKKQVNDAVNLLIDSLAVEGSLEHFNITIKHNDGELYTEKTSKRKFKIKK